MKTIDEKAAIVLKGLEHRARRRFKEGNYTNPFSVNEQEPVGMELRLGMYLVYQDNLDKLKKRVGKDE